jgi:hypothetical protein
MTNTNQAAATVHPALSNACKECGAAAGVACAPYAGADIGGKTVLLEIGEASYEKTPVKIGAGRLAYETHAERRRQNVGTVVTLHTSRVPAAKAPRAERLVASDKAGAKALAQEDDSECKAKRPVYVAVYYRSMGDENVAFIAGPMTPGAAANLRSMARDTTNVVPGTHAATLTAEDAERWLATGEVKNLGARLIKLPSQYGAVGTVRGEDEQDAGEVEATPDPLAALVSRRPQAVAVQGSWLDALAV